MIAAFLLGFYLTVASPAQLPFTIEATENDSASFPEAPRIESASFAQWKGRWLFIGGRIAGYHAVGGASADFPRADANREVWVVDTKCQPARTYHVKIDLLSSALAPLKDEWASTGQAYYQDGPNLYIAGGYGQDSTGHWVTYSLISKVNVPRLIDGVLRGKLDSSAVTYVHSKLTQSAGGELAKLDDGCFYLVMGHVFTGSYTAFEGQGERSSEGVSQVYLNEIRRLNISDRGSLTVTLLDRFQDENEFHRRDLNLATIISPKGKGLGVYGGVFTSDQLSYSKPIYLLPGEKPYIDMNFDQKLNAYRTAKLLLHDSAQAVMYTNFLGGISRYRWDSSANQFKGNTKLGDKSASTYLDGMQWSDQISTIRRSTAAVKEETSEFVQPAPLPAFVGTEALFIPLPDVKRVSADSDVLDLQALRGTKTLVGYLYGGIRAIPFRFPYDKTAMPYNAGTVPTKPNDLILKVYVKVGNY